MVIKHKHDLHIILCDCGIMARLLTVALLIVLISSVVLAENIDICVRCTESSDPLSQCDSLIDGKNCLTFSELIGYDEIFNFNGTFILRKNTTINIRLSPGLHLFNSTEYDLYISRVQSVVLTGEGATVTCLSKYTTITFAEVSSYINISGITFDSCSLEFKYFFMHTVGNLFFTSTVFIDSIITQRSNPDDMYLVRWDGQRGCESHKKLEIVNTSFINSTFSATMDLFLHEHVPMGTLCIIVALQKVVFKDIIAHDHSVALYLFKVHSINLTDTTFQNVCGSSVVAECVHAVALRSVAFVNNRCTGSLLQLQNVHSIDYSGNCIFKYNTNSEGVVISEVKRQMITPKSMVEFRNNDFNEVVFSFHGFEKQESMLNIWKSTLIFENNTSGGAIILLDHVMLMVKKGSQLIFKRNRSLQLQLKPYIPSAILLLQSVTASFMSNSRILFSNNTAERSGGITSVDSNIIIGTNHIVFEYNEGGDGGGMAFYKKSCIQCNINVQQKIYTAYFSNNRAHRNGGAIFVEDSDYAESWATVLIDLNFFWPTASNLYLQFVNNTAKMAGNDLYGGWIDTIRYGVHISSTYPQTDHYAITSDPTRICMCNNSIPVCNITKHHIKVFPGQRFAIEAVAVGQRMGLVPSSVIVQFNTSDDDEGSLGEGQSVQSVNDKCSNLYFAVFSEKKEKSVQLTIPNMDARYLFVLRWYLKESYHILLEQFSITVELKDCPLGFFFNTTSKTCSCLSSIVHHSGVQCDHDTFTVHRSKYKWIAATFDHVKYQNHGVLVHDQCPHDYCRTDSDSLSIRLESPDSQCAFRRSGDLCGSCQQKLSQVFGTSRCKKCSNIAVLGVIPGVLLAGLVLIVFIAVLNMTVTVGTINGLIFYANVIQASKSIFFPHDNGSSFSSILIAWLNLDLGIEACFYDGLDAYAKTWLQFAFPIYLWLLLIAIIVSSHYSVRVSKYIPNNALQVLATIFLLSYAKIIRNVITVFSSTVLTYPDGYEKRVWLYDGNVEFLTGKHIPLFIATLLLLILLSIPYTLSLVSIQCLLTSSYCCGCTS